MHKRTPEIIASQHVGMKYFIEYAKDVGAINESKAEELLNRCWDALGQAGHKQIVFQKAMEPAQRFLELISSALSSGRAHLAGATAEMMDIRTVTQADFYRVAALSLCVIYVMVVVLLRDAVLAAFMVASTVLSYFATLGAAFWVFTGLLGHAGLDWKVEVFLFVVMVAVGVDYNIFLASRLSQEARRLPGKLAICRAVIHTGPVISSCGLIMAATLGSLMAGDLTLLHQLGFALALGMLIDSFLVRPLLLPAFAALSGRTGRALDLGAGFNRRRRS